MVKGAKTVLERKIKETWLVYLNKTKIERGYNNFYKYIHRVNIRGEEEPFTLEDTTGTKSKWFPVGYEQI